MQDRIERFHILSQNIWNFDEKGFLIGVSRKCKRVITLTQYLAKQLLSVNQDGNREFIILISAINILGMYISSAFIYQNESGALIDTWFNDYDIQELTTYFATSEKAWSNENMGMH